MEKSFLKTVVILNMLFFSICAFAQSSSSNVPNHHAVSDSTSNYMVVVDNSLNYKKGSEGYNINYDFTEDEVVVTTQSRNRTKYDNNSGSKSIQIVETGTKKPEIIVIDTSAIKDESK